ncbi:HesB/IscA family protein [Wenxinia saemankumensis]|uniref:Iron-sulfur cluster assembly accessory protein n=1 Tax=Wenxinia saemankumensis TaxID=1447782 RepID=A0A1M6H0Z5_9RHOB|nr:iron-sulfur cluster assembly accessory protein [Wenxinia saemankumensis]SHJ15868.1 Iron-sulfur cluster assembly accessory protein [Wenxinia saemankumensis]
MLTLPPKVTPATYDRLAEIGAAAEGKALRIAVEGGGCSGFQYAITLDAAQEDDLVLSGGAGQSVVVDPTSLPFLADAVIDFRDELIGARFVIDNPNAASSCGCGTSFAM